MLGILSLLLLLLLGFTPGSVAAPPAPAESMELSPGPGQGGLWAELYDDSGESCTSAAEGEPSAGDPGWGCLEEARRNGTAAVLIVPPGAAGSAEFRYFRTRTDGTLEIFTVADSAGGDLVKETCPAPDPVWLGCR